MSCVLMEVDSKKVFPGSAVRSRSLHSRSARFSGVPVERVS